MAWDCAACSIERLEAHPRPSTSARTMIRCNRFHTWQANLRILDVTEIKTVPYVPSSHPFVERLIGTVRRECLDRTLFWTTADLENKLLDFQNLLQPPSHAYRTGGTPPRRRTASSGREPT